MINGAFLYLLKTEQLYFISLVYARLATQVLRHQHGLLAQHRLGYDSYLTNQSLFELTMTAQLSAYQLGNKLQSQN